MQLEGAHMANIFDTNDAHAPADDQYGSFSIDDDIVIYDIENPTRWIQSDTTVTIADSA